MSLGARITLWIALAVTLVAGWWRLTAFYEAKGYSRAQAEARAAAEVLNERNRELQRAAEKRYLVVAETRDRFIVTTVKEIRHATTHLAACPVGEPAVRLLNDAARCARGDAAACPPGG